MKEQPKHIDAFLRYYALTDRSIPALEAELDIRRKTLYRWSKEFDWVNRVEALDSEVNNRVVEELIGDWVRMKSYLLRVLIQQIDKGVDAGIKPRTTSDIVNAVKEIRSLLGQVETEGDKHEKIEYVRTLTNDETSGSNKDI